MLTKKNCDELEEIIKGLEFFQDVLFRISLNAESPAYLRAARTALGNGQTYIEDELDKARNKK